MYGAQCGLLSLKSLRKSITQNPLGARLKKLEI